MEKKPKNDSTKIANAHYHPGVNKQDDEISSALAMTHEQVTDAYMEGEIGAKTDRSKE